jgi:hypothetical protein
MISYKKSWYLDKAGLVYHYIFLPRLEKAVVLRQAKKIEIDVSNSTGLELFRFTINQHNLKKPEFTVNICTDKRQQKFIQENKKYGLELMSEIASDFNAIPRIDDNLKLTMKYDYYIDPKEANSYSPYSLYSQQCLIM